MEKSEIRTVIKHEFLRGTNASQTARNINNVYGCNVVTQQTVSNWFVKFRSGNFDLKNEPRGRPESKINNDELKTAIESDPSQSAYELSLKFGVTKKTILTHLNEIGKVKKLNQIVTSNEKNGKRAALWLDKDESPKHTPEPIIQEKELMQPAVKIEVDPLLVTNTPAENVRTTMKRAGSVCETEPNAKIKKYALQTIANTGGPLNSFEWQQTIGGSSANPNELQKPIGTALSTLPLNTTQITVGSNKNVRSATSAVIPTKAITAFRTNGSLPSVLLQRELTKRTIRSVTLELIDRNPLVHLGVPANRLDILKNVICVTANVSFIDCYITLKKLRQNEDFALLADYFEMTESEVQQTFAINIVRLARYLRYLVLFPNSKKYYDRHKSLPFSFRTNLSHVQSLIELVETEMYSPQQIECSNYKYILSISTNGIICYISDAYVGYHDDLKIIKSTNFHSAIPKYLSLVAVPGKAIRHKRKLRKSSCAENNEAHSNTDAADAAANNSTDTDDEHILSHYAATRVAANIASHRTLNVVNSKLVSRKVKNYSIPTMKVQEPVCRLQIRHVVNNLREFKLLQPYAIKEPMLFNYLNEVLVVASALINFQR